MHIKSINIGSVDHIFHNCIITDIERSIFRKEIPIATIKFSYGHKTPIIDFDKADGTFTLKIRNRSDGIASIYSYRSDKGIIFTI